VVSAGGRRVHADQGGLRRRAGGESVEQIQPDLITPPASARDRTPRWRASTGRSPDTPNARRTQKPSSRPTPTSPTSRHRRPPALPGRRGAQQLMTIIVLTGISCTATTHTRPWTLPCAPPAERRDPSSVRALAHRAGGGQQVVVTCGRAGRRGSRRGSGSSAGVPPCPEGMR
jgi:hypothetical protein